VHSLGLKNVACAQNPERAGRKARIHSGAVAGKQPGSGPPRNVLISSEFQWFSGS
jgi:hypothetical protein